MREYGSNIILPSLDNLFSSEQERQDAKLEKIQILPLSELHPFEGHPFQVRDDEEMDKMVDSVKEYGVMTPAIVRPRRDGGYEIVAGHRRCHASRRARVNTILYPSGASNEEVLARLPADIVLATTAQCYAEVGNEEYLHQMALAVSVEVCGRLGISPPADVADRLNGLRAHIPAGEERRALEEVREMAKVFGDTVCKELDLQRPRSDLQRAEER